MYNEGKEVTIMGAVDLEIERTRNNWLKDYAGKAFRDNYLDQVAGDIALDLFNGELVPDSTVSAFNRKRQIEMIASYYFPDLEQDEPFSRLVMRIETPKSTFWEVTSPINPFRY